MKNFIYLVGTRTRDSPSRSVVLQPSTLPRAPLLVACGVQICSSPWAHCASLSILQRSLGPNVLTALSLNCPRSHISVTDDISRSYISLRSFSNVARSAVHTGSNGGN
jgi:hypothetical protein